MPTQHSPGPTLPTDVDAWAAAAEQWIAWVRTPNHDAFWAYQSAFEAFVGPGPGEGIELGAGEGRISRVLSNLGWQMAVVEPVPTLLSAARAARSGRTYHQCPAHAVPADVGPADLIVLYNMLMDVDDVDATLVGARRLVRSTGRVVVGIVHPILDILMARRLGDLERSFLVPNRFDQTVERNGLTMRFQGWERPMSVYVNALCAAGFRITRMAEPAPEPDHPVTRRLKSGQVTPNILWIEARPL